LLIPAKAIVGAVLIWAVDDSLTMRVPRVGHVIRTEVSRALVRRTIGLWLSPVAVVAAWLVIGPAMTAVMLGAGVACALARRGVRVITRRGGGNAREGARFIAPVASLAWALAGAAIAAAPDDLRAGRVLHELRRVSAAVALGHSHGAASWATVIDLLVGGALVSSLFLARGLRHPDAVRGESSQAALDRARAIVAEHGDDSLSPYILRPDKEFQFAEDGVVAFAVIGDTVIISGDPVGPPDQATAALRVLVGRARQAGLHVAAYGVSERHLEAFRALGLHAVRAGEEAVVDPRAFTVEGRAVRKLRQSVHRLERQGWMVVMREGREIDVELQAEIDAVESRWRAQHEQILGFAMSMGEFELTIRANDLYVLAFSPEGQLRGLLRFLAHRKKLSLDVMRRVGEVPNGLTEALVCHALQCARTRQIEEVSLNYAGLAHLLRPDAPGGRFRTAVAQRLLRPLRSRFQMDRLVQFNEKFSPCWRPRYLVLDSRLGLPRTIFRVLQAEGYLRRRPSWRWRSSARRARPASGTVEHSAGG
jgi:lysyl-tRNA synthetase class 2